MSMRSLLVIGGAVAAVGAAAFLKRDKVAGLLPSRAGEPAPPAPVPTPPQPSNYDAPGPVANTATPIPAPDPQEQPPAAIDESAEEAAAAAELGERADEAHRPLQEAGEGESEGEEQAEAELADNATYRDAGMSDAERQIDDTIEQAGQPQTGETPETVAEPDQGEAAADTDAQEPPATPGGGISGRPFSGQGEPEDAPESGDDDWRTWSGRSVDT
jgi:hypothetical protein